MFTKVHPQCNVMLINWSTLTERLRSPPLNHNDLVYLKGDFLISVVSSALNHTYMTLTWSFPIIHLLIIPSFLKHILKYQFILQLNTIDLLINKYFFGLYKNYCEICHSTLIITNGLVFRYFYTHSNRIQSINI